MEIKSHKDLIVWQRAIELIKIIYQITGRFPAEELYGLVNQMRRAAISIASNIAEGRSRGTRKDFTQFLRMAMGSTAELETQIIIAQDLYSHADFRQAESLLTEISKMLTSMIQKLKANS